MNIVKLTSWEAKAKGAIDREMSTEDVLVFEDITPGMGFHMRGVSNSLDILFLDRDYAPLERVTMEPDTGTATAPAGTAMAVEVLEGAFPNVRVGEVWKHLYAKM